jgi:two-component system sensor histidine kinase YesM
MDYLGSKLKLSLKNKLLIYFILVACIPTFLMSIYSYNTIENTLKQNTGENSYKVICNSMEKINEQVDQANDLSDFVYVENNIITLLKRLHSQSSVYDSHKKQAIENIKMQFQYIPVTKYITSFFIIGDNGLDIRNGSEAALINPQVLTKSIWFETGMKLQGGISWGKITKNYTRITSNKYIIPECRTIKDLNSGKKLGYSVILFNQNIFKDCYNQLLLKKGEKIFLTNSHGDIISTNQPIKLKTNRTIKKYYKYIFKNNKTKYFEKVIDNKLYLITHKKSAITGWTLIEMIPLTQIELQQRVIMDTTIFIIINAILICLVLSFYLSEKFGRPIGLMVKQVNEIAHGNFNTQINLNSEDEIGELGRSITKMSQDIKNLIQESVYREKQKRLAEMKMLQSQINPHFLYNTLNSIKLMAVLQGSKGIETMIGCLGHILKAALSDLNEVVPLYEELSILDDYIHIQKIRYKGKIHFSKNISDETLLNCSIIKFILQPILENTILHGIQPKDEAGEVIISVCQDENNLIIDIWDNGIGMSDEKIKKIEKSCDIEEISHLGDSIGLKNVNQRIKLVYGDEYGLKFESKLGEYTKVTITLPINEYKRASNKEER